MNAQEYNNSGNIEKMLPSPELCVQIRTFGFVKIENTLGRFEENRKTQSTSVLLLKYLIANSNRPVCKAELFELFWPNNPDPSNTLRVWMGRLRAFFTPLNLSGPNGLILTSGGYYRLNPNYVAQIDCIRLDQIAAQLSMVDQATPEGLKLCAEALELYQGNYLENTEDLPWLEKRREHYRETFYYLATTTLNYMRALNDTSLLPLLLKRATAFIPPNDIIHDRIAAFQCTLQTQTNLAYFRSAGPADQLLKDDVYIRMFGPLELENHYGRVVDPETLRYPSNSWLLFKYLLKNRGREVSQIELMEKFWPNEMTSETDDGAFRVRLSRLRKALKPLHLDGRTGLVLFSSGFYSLNPDYTIYTDEDTFVQLMAQISNIPADDPKGLALCAGALDLFRDRYLACTPAHPWLESLQTHYDQEFCRLAYSTLDRMKALNDFHCLPLLCHRAPTVVPEEAVLHIELISLMVEKQLLRELVQYISKLSQHEGEQFEWLEPAPLSSSDASTYIKSDKDIRIRLFGPVDLENQCGHVTEDPVPTFRWLLLKYLLANPGRLITQEELDQNVWSGINNNDSETAQSQLRRRLREALFPLNLKGRGLVVFFEGCYGLNPKYKLITDTDILNANMKQLQNTPLEDPAGLQLCFEALSLFRAPFMEYAQSANWLTDCRKLYDQIFFYFVHSALERMKTLRPKEGLFPLWQSAVAYAPGNQELHMKILNCMVEQNLPAEMIPYVCSLARLDSPETEWFHNL